MAKINEIDITSLLFQEGAAPSTPASTKWRAYFKTDGLYIIDDAGAETGPLAASAAAAFVGARVYHNATQAIATGGAAVAVAFNSERYDTDAFHDTATNNSRLTVPSGKGGKYLITGNIRFAANTTGNRYLHIQLNGTTLIASVHATALNANQDMSLTTVYDLSAADYVELMAFQSSGGNLNLTAAGNYSPEFTISKIG